MRGLACFLSVAASLLAVPAAAQDHSAHQHHAPPAAAPQEPPVDPHAGHVMPAASADPHAGHGPQAASAGNALPPAPPRDHSADAIHDPARMARSREDLRKENGEITAYAVLFDLAEYQARAGGDGYRWDSEAWFGGDTRRLVLRSEGEGTFGEPIEELELQALYSLALDPFWDLKMGLRHDVVPNPSRTHAVIGIEGDAPYWLDVEAQLFLSDQGEVTARLEASYDLRITQRLVLRPSAEFDVSAQDMPDIGVGQGVSAVEAGLRLRYEVVPEFAPYVGFEWNRKLGQTARYARTAGEDAGGSQFVAGVRFWF
jgi:copper resistance protein B